MEAMEHPLARILRECLASGELVAVHKWGDDPSIFFVGRIVELGPDDFTLKLIDTDGSWEASPPESLKLSRVLGIDRRTPYLVRLQAWLDEFDGEPGSGLKSKVVSSSPDKIRSAISDAFASQMPIDLKLREDEYVTCIITGLIDDWIFLSTLDDLCQLLGESFVRLDAVVGARHFGRSREREAWLYRRNLHSSR